MWYADAIMWARESEGSLAFAASVASAHAQARPCEAGVCGRVRAATSYDPSLGFAVRHTGKPDEEPNERHVTHEPLGDSACRVTFRIDREPEAALAAHESGVLAAVNQVVAEDLARFKDFIEARAEEAG